MAEPIVSVCIPAYQGADYISEAIESVLRQQFGDFELLVLDDCSRDGTEEIVRGYQREDARVRYVRNETNAGMVENWNRCLVQARGRYIKYLFQDDLFTLNDSLGRMVELLKQDPEVSLVATARRVIDHRSEPVRIDSCFRADVRAEGRSMIRYCFLKHGNMIGEPSAVLFRKSQAVRGFNPAYRQIVDLEMWFHLLEQGKFAYLAEPLCGFRVHEEQQTRKNADTLAHMEDFQLLFSDYLSREYLGFGLLARHYIRYHQFYEIWKLSGMDVYNRRLALDKISRYYGKIAFYSLLPFHKLCDPVFKYRRSRLRRRLLNGSR